MSRLQQVLSEAIRDLDVQALMRHPEGKWCAAEILEHLNLTYSGTIKNLERCLEAGSPRVSADRKQDSWARLLITRLGYFPGGRKSPDRVLPRGQAAEQVLKEIFENLGRMDGVISRCESQFGFRQPIADHPILGPLTAAEWRGFHLTHGRHHARQILKLRKPA
jgi:DinB superfamily